MIIFLYGQDTFRSRKKLEEFKEKFLRDVDPSGNSLFIVDGSAASMEKINEFISPSSLFSRRRMVVVENLFLNKGKNIFDQLLQYLKTKKESKETDNILIFWDSLSGEEKLTKIKSDLFKFLAKQKYSLPEFKNLSNTQTTSWVKKEVELRNGKISGEAASALSAILGSDLWRISNEIDKLINYKASQRLNIKTADIIEAKDVEKLVRGQFDENIFALTDAISLKNKAAAIKLFEEQIDAGLTDAHLLNMITRQFRTLLQIKQAIDSGLTSRKIITLLKLHPFVVQKGINQARNFSLVILKNIFEILVEIDYKMKTGKGDVKTELSLLISRL